MCHPCFDGLPAKLLAETCKVKLVHAEAHKRVVEFECSHEKRRGHAIYKNNPEWLWALTLKA